MKDRWRMKRSNTFVMSKGVQLVVMGGWGGGL